MRVMFLLLVLANLMFFGWASWVDRPAARPRTAARIPALQLAERPAAPAADAARSRCRSLGSWPDEAAALAAGAVLARRGVAYTVRRADTSVADGYGVFVAAADAEQQRRALQQLARAGLRDAALVGDAGATGRVSAGVFSEQAGAAERAAAVRAAGLEPQIEERRRSLGAWWLDLRLAAQQGEPRSDDAELAQGVTALQWADCPR